MQHLANHGPMMEHWARHGDRGWFLVGRGIALLVFLALTAMVVVALFAWLQRRSPVAATPAGTRDDAALGEVRLRYARGEISRDDYLRLASDLGGTVPGPPPAS